MTITLDPLPFFHDYSMKNIPTPSRNEHQRKLIIQASAFINKLRWHVFFFLLKYRTQQNKSSLNTDDTLHFADEKENFGFKTEKAAPFIPELQDFEKSFWKLIKSVKYFNRTNKFQNKLKQDLSKLRQLDKVVIFADKSNKIYCADVNEYNQEVRKNVTKEYKKAKPQKVDESNHISAKIAKDLNLENRMEGHTPSNCFITIKDHKETFPSKIDVRLIAPSKSDIGKVSKKIIQRIVCELNEKLRLNQWRDPCEVTKWFNNIKLKRNASFLKFDIVNFYPSISKELLERSLGPSIN